MRQDRLAINGRGSHARNAACFAGGHSLARLLVQKKCWMWPRWGRPASARSGLDGWSQGERGSARGGNGAEGCGARMNILRSMSPAGIWDYWALSRCGSAEEALRRCAGLHAGSQKNHRHQVHRLLRGQCPGDPRSCGPFQLPQTVRPRFIDPASHQIQRKTACPCRARRFAHWLVRAVPAGTFSLSRASQSSPHSARRGPRCWPALLSLGALVAIGSETAGGRRHSARLGGALEVGQIGDVIPPRASGPVSSPHESVPSACGELGRQWEQTRASETHPFGRQV